MGATGFPPPNLPTCRGAEKPALCPCVNSLKKMCRNYCTKRVLNINQLLKACITCIVISKIIERTLGALR